MPDAVPARGLGGEGGSSCWAGGGWDVEPLTRRHRATDRGVSGGLRQQPDQFLGLHFFSPVAQVPLLEVITGEATSEATVARALAFCRQIKKTPIVVNDAYGFYTTRVFSSYLMEAAQLLAEGHDPALVEWAARSAGMAIGPLQVFDEVTLTLVRKAMPQGERYTGRTIDTPGFELLCAMVDDHKRYGRAAGAGFYEYVEGKRTRLWPGLAALAKTKATGSAPEALGHRLLLAQCVEAVRAAEQGVLVRHRDAEVGAIFGLGFAPNTGGPLSYLDRRGLPNVVRELEALATEHGDHYRPPNLLVEMAQSGKRFFEAV